MLFLIGAYSIWAAVTSIQFNVTSHVDTALVYIASQLPTTRTVSTLQTIIVNLEKDILKGV